MASFDSDLRSIQQARTLVVAARDAQRQWATANQGEVDRVCAAMADAAYRASEWLGRIASEETGYGVPTHKMLKNHLSSRVLWEYIKDIEDIYYEHQAPHRTEERQKEYAAITSRYRDVVRPLQIEETATGFRMHGFTYKTMRAAGDLREWDIIVHRDGQVDVDLKLLETGIGELFWSWAP